MALIISWAISSSPALTRAVKAGVWAAGKRRSGGARHRQEQCITAVARAGVGRCRDN